MKKWILALFFANFITVAALADIYVEPSLGYNLGSYTLKTTAGDLPGALGGLGLGLKAGYSIATFFGGLDLQYNMLTTDPDSATEAEDDLKQTMIGISAGVDLVLLRAWLGYYFSNSFEVDGSAQKLSGTAFKIGAGYTLIPMLSLNAEYIMSTYDEIEPTSALFTEATHSVFLISVSVPLSI